MLRANDDKPQAQPQAPAQPQPEVEKHGLQGKGASKRLLQESKEEPLVPLGIVIGAFASLLLGYTSYYYRRQMRIMRIEEQEKAKQAVKSRLTQIISASGLFSVMTAMMGYTMCKFQTPKPVPHRKRKDKAKKLRKELEANGEA